MEFVNSGVFDLPAKCRILKARCFSLACVLGKKGWPTRLRCRLETKRSSEGSRLMEAVSSEGRMPMGLASSSERHSELSGREETE